MPRAAQIESTVVQPAREETQTLPQEPMRVIVHGEDGWEEAVRQERLSLLAHHAMGVLPSEGGATFSGSTQPALEEITTIMAKSVKTNLDGVSGSQSSDKFWENLFSEAQFLCTPSRVSEGRRQLPPSQTTSLSSTGPNSCNQVFASFYDHDKRLGRAEGCGNELQLSRELGLPSGSLSETSKPASSKRTWLRVVRRVLARGRASYHEHWFRRSEHSVMHHMVISSLAGIAGKTGALILGVAALRIMVQVAPSSCQSIQESYPRISLMNCCSGAASRR